MERPRERREGEREREREGERERGREGEREREREGERQSREREQREPAADNFSLLSSKHTYVHTDKTDIHAY
jgi:hypothetical protein